MGNCTGIWGHKLKKGKHEGAQKMQGGTLKDADEHKGTWYETMNAVKQDGICKNKREHVKIYGNKRECWEHGSIKGNMAEGEK